MVFLPLTFMAKLHNSMKFPSLDLFVFCTKIVVVSILSTNPNFHHGMFASVFDHFQYVHSESLYIFQAMGAGENICETREYSLYFFPSTFLVMDISLPSSPEIFSFLVVEKTHIYHEWMDLFKMHQTIKYLKPGQDQALLENSTSRSNGFTCRNIIHPPNLTSMNYMLFDLPTACMCVCVCVLIHILG